MADGNMEEVSSTHDTNSRADGTAATAPTHRLRYPRTVFVPLFIAAVCALPFAIGLGPWGLLLALPFIAVAYALSRLGADITTTEVRVHGVLTSVTVARSDLVGFGVPDGRHVHLLRADGSSVRIPTARPRDLPRLRELLFSDLAADPRHTQG